jgi:uncharacterized membrane protein
MHTFSTSEAVKFAWSTVKKNLGFFIILSVLVLGIALGSEMLGEPESSYGFNAQDGLAYILLVVLNFILSIWVVRVGIDAVDAKKLTFSNLAPTWGVAWKYALSNALVALVLVIPASLVMGVVVALGFGSIFGTLMMGATFGLTNLFLLGALLVFFLVVLIYLGARLMFVAYYVVDQKLGPIESVKASWRVTQGVVLKIVGLMIVLVFINMVGMLALFIGLLVTIPITVVSWAYAYRSLAPSHDSVPTPAGDLVEPIPTPTTGE